MREFKFRAWDKFNKVMTYSDNNYPLSEYKIEFNLGNENKLSLMKLIDARYGEFRTFDADIMQYTGLKDINGKEIYEGDIIKFYYRVPLCMETNVVRFNNGKYYVGEFNITSINLAEVIGDVYENKDLLFRKLDTKGRIVYV